WMYFLMRINPMAYAVDGLRNIMYNSPELKAMTQFNLSFDIGVIAVFGFVITILAVIAFNIKE
ncbi:MAG: ABC transporter permease, partial [Bacillota bacterium]